MATEKQWVVRYKHYITPTEQSNHIAFVHKLTEDTETPFHAEISEAAAYSIGGETKGYLAKFDDDTKAQLESLQEIYEVEPLQQYKHVEFVTQESAEWHLARLNSTGPVTGPTYKYRYRTEASGAGVTAYIIDTGINDKHEEFGTRASKGPIFVQDETTATSIHDIYGHGTHVAGTIGGKTYGVAKDVTLVGIKVFNDHTGTASTIDIIKALEWVVTDVYSTNPRKRAVVNLSLGGGASSAMDAAIAATVRQDIVVVVAAGNEQRDADTTSPAREPLAITVGATDIYDNKSWFSNYGRKVDIFAPGEDITSAWIAEIGQVPTNKETAKIDGTSMASPHVAGVAATILSDTQKKGIANAQDVISHILIDSDRSGVKRLDVPVKAKYTTTSVILQVK